MTDTQAMVQNKFSRVDNVRLNVAYSVSPDLGNTFTQFNYRVFFEVLGTYRIGNYVGVNYGSVFGLKGLDLREGFLKLGQGG